MKLKCHTCRKEVVFRLVPKRLPRKFECNLCKEQARRVRRNERLERRRKKRAAMREVPYPKQDWKREKKFWCECCGKAYISKPFTICGILQPRRTEHSHHIIPRRLAARQGDADSPINLLSCCGQCHGRFKRIDERILSNDWVGAVQVARELHFPMDRLKVAAGSFSFDIARLVEV